MDIQLQINEAVRNAALIVCPEYIHNMAYVEYVARRIVMQDPALLDEPEVLQSMMRMYINWSQNYFLNDTIIMQLVNREFKRSIPGLELLPNKDTP